jgi:hypothetical protein
LRQSPSSWSHSEVITDLVDDTLIIRTPGASLLNQEQAPVGELIVTQGYPSLHRAGKWTILLPDRPIHANEAFQIVMECEPEIVNTSLCVSQYHVHFRGPTAISLPPEEELYAHDPESGRTVIKAILPQAGWYEVWAWRDQSQPGSCAPQIWDGPCEQAVGSGQLMVEVIRPRRSRDVEADHMRPCASSDYQGDQPGRWVSVGHVREQYRRLEWYQSHLKRNGEHLLYAEYVSSRKLSPTAETFFTPSSMPDYKRPALNYRRSIEEIKDVRHVTYIGDSILRTSYCGNLFTTFHGEVSGQCSYADDLMDYHYSDKSFSVPIEPFDRRSDPRDHVVFSQRFVDNYFPASADRIRTLTQLEPVTHIVANVGMWFAALEPEEYMRQVTDFLQIIIDTFGSDVKIAWLGTPSVAPGIVCYNDMKRVYLSRHRCTAAMAIASLRRRYQNLDIGIVDGWTITDNRPETSSDGRCVVTETGVLTLQALGSGGRAAGHSSPATRQPSRRCVHGDNLGSMAQHAQRRGGSGCGGETSVAVATSWVL